MVGTLHNINMRSFLFLIKSKTDVLRFYGHSFDKNIFCPLVFFKFNRQNIAGTKHSEFVKTKTTTLCTDLKFFSLFFTVNDQSVYVDARQLSVGQVRFVINPFTRNQAGCFAWCSLCGQFS